MCYSVDLVARNRPPRDGGSGPDAVVSAMPNRSDLKRAGLKSTAPRLKILGMLEDNAARHVTAEDIYRALLETGEEIALATVYRVLTQFEQAGLIIRHNFEGGRSVFELNDESHHDHMVCVECGKVFEFVDKTIEKRQKHVARCAGFVMHDHSLYLYGVCQGMHANGRCSMKSDTGIIETSTPVSG